MLTGPLRDRRYRHLFAAQVTALAGTGLTTIALALLASELGGARGGQVLGVALALKMVAYVGIQGERAESRRTGRASTSAPTRTRPAGTS